MTTAHLPGHLLPVKSAELGRLVLNANKPSQDFIDPTDDPKIEKKFIKTSQVNYKETRRFSKSSNLRSYLGDIISFAYERKRDCIATLSAPQATTYDLENSESWFRDVCGQEKLREFLEQAMRNDRNVYLIVGYRTVSDGSLVKTLTDTKVKGVKLQTPISASHIGMVSSNIAIGVLGPGMRSKRSFGKGQELSFGAPGEQIFAILYRKVKCKWLSRKTTENMVLETNNRWKSVWNWRGPAKQGDEPNVIEATLTDLDEDDLDISDDESDSATDDVDEAEDSRGKLPRIENPSELMPGILERFRTEYWHGLILLALAIVCGGLSILLRGAFK